MNSDVNRIFALNVIKTNPHFRSIFYEMVELLRASYVQADSGSELERRIKNLLIEFIPGEHGWPPAKPEITPMPRASYYDHATNSFKLQEAVDYDPLTLKRNAPETQIESALRITEGTK